MGNGIPRIFPPPIKLKESDKFEIYKLIHNLAEQGIAILVISSELPEILGLCDRIMVLSKGIQKAILSREQATQELIMEYAVQ